MTSEPTEKFKTIRCSKCGKTVYLRKKRPWFWMGTCESCKKTYAYRRVK